MNSVNENFILKSFLIVALIVDTVVVTSQNQFLSQFEGAYLAREKYPKKASSLDWFPDDYEVQGITNDGANWFFTIVDQGKTHGIMWKIPKEIDINNNVKGKHGVLSIDFNNIPQIKGLKDDKFWHWGDLDHAKIDEIDYILIPINSNPPAIICFEANNLKYKNYAYLDDKIPGGGGWCAIGPADNELYVSENNATSVVRYSIDWDKLINTQNHSGIFKYMQNYPLTKQDGSPLYMTDMQGGEFTPSGEMLYLVSGRGLCIEGAEWSLRDGIHAIGTMEWKEISHSLKNSHPKTNFSYNYDPTCDICFFGPIPTGGGTDTPEGLTFWNLENDPNNKIQGSLHVLLDHYTYGGADCDDELTLFHFSTNLHVDTKGLDEPSIFQDNLLGRNDSPFKTISAAYKYYPAWNGSKLIITSGSYQGKGIYSKRMIWQASGGSVIIGN